MEAERAQSVLEVALQVRPRLEKDWKVPEDPDRDTGAVARLEVFQKDQS